MCLIFIYMCNSKIKMQSQCDVSADDRSPVSETHRWKESSFHGVQKTFLYQRGWEAEVRALSRHKLNFSMSNAL